MSRPSCICQPSERTQPKQPVAQGFPTVPTKNFASPPGCNKEWLAVGKWQGCARLNVPLSANKATPRVPRRIRFTSGRVLLFEPFGDVVQTPDDFLGFLAGGVRREEEHAAGKRGTDIGGAQPAFLFQFPGTELGEDGDMSASILCGHAVKNESAVSVVLHLHG